MTAVAAQICIVGGGVIGLMTARELAMAGADVCVVEAGQCGKESSWAGGGIVSPLYPWRYPPAVTALAKWAQQAYPALSAQLLADTGIDPEWQQSGLVLLNIPDREKAVQWAQEEQRHMLIWPQQALAAAQPDLATDVESAICFPDVAQVRNPRLMQALLRDVIRRGVTVLTESPVQQVIADRAGETITALAATTGRIQAEQFVVCAGAWTRRLLADVTPAVNIEPVRGQMLLFAPHAHRLRHIVLRDGRYLIPRRDGRILCGSTLEQVGFAKVTTDDARESLLRSACAIMPSLRGVPIEQHWAGLRPGSVDGIPHIGRVPGWHNLWVNAGHFRNGIVLAPASSRLLADMLLQRPPLVEPEPYQCIQ
ncbi:MAG TPA: glycine oxidase ThiO [Permianibacter sp.]|nr:glycine oxidase ThiO [Permianibacter sp.]